MTLTELRYIVAVANTRHFGRAAQACFVTQPTLSVAIRKLEDELGTELFERGGTEIQITHAGKKIIEQAEKILDAVSALKETARNADAPFEGALRLGIIHTIGPYLLPRLVPQMIKHYPKMPLLLQEQYTEELLHALRHNSLDCAVLAQPIPDSGLTIKPLYDEPFVVAMSKNHPLANAKQISSDRLASQDLLLLGSGHCFRDHVLSVCATVPQLAHTDQAGIQRSVEGSSLETIRHMVAAGIGLTVLPSSAAPPEAHLSPQTDAWLTYIPFAEPAPTRRVALAWRKAYSRMAAMDAVADRILDCKLPGMRPLAPNRL